MIQGEWMDELLIQTFVYNRRMSFPSGGASQCARLCPACGICRQMCSRWKPSCTPPAPVAALGPLSALSCQIHCSDHPRWQEALGAAQHWTCQLGLLSRVSRCKRQLSRLFTYFSNFELGTVRREANSEDQRKIFFFPPELLKKAGLLQCKKRYDIRENREIWLLFQNFLVFTLIYSGNIPQVSVTIWNEAAEGGTSDGACCSLWVSPCRWWWGFIQKQAHYVSKWESSLHSALSCQAAHTFEDGWHP